MISQEQSMMIERQQNQSLKNIYGLGISSQKMRDMSGLETLEERRILAVKKFALKNAENPRFDHWFVERPVLGRGRMAHVGNITHQ